MVATVDNGYSYYCFKSFIKKYINTSCQQLQPLTTGIHIYYFGTFIEKHMKVVVKH